MLRQMHFLRLFRKQIAPKQVSFNLTLDLMLKMITRAAKREVKDSVEKVALIGGGKTIIFDLDKQVSKPAS